MTLRFEGQHIMTNHNPPGQVPEALRLADECGYELAPGTREEIAAELLRLHAENEALRTQQPAPAAGVTVEQVEDAIGLQSTAWDTIGAEKIVEAVLRLTNGQAPATQQAGVVLSDDLRDRLVAISEAIADQDDRAAQAMLREILEVPQADSQPAPDIDALCARIKAADDAAADRDYMLDSDDCIKVLRGEWKAPLAMDKPDRAARAPADSVLEDAADPLQGAANWLAEAHGQFCVAVLQGCLMIGYNRAKRLHDVAIAARKQGANHD